MKLHSPIENDAREIMIGGINFCICESQRTQYCRNTNGSYVCEALTACESGYRRAQNGSCVDVDECLESLHTCSRESHRYCVNLEGSYECITRLPSCWRGFEYSLFTQQCEDIDECRVNRGSCGPSERCVNLPGSYRCERAQPELRGHNKRPACPAGYSYDPALRKCSGNDRSSPSSLRQWWRWHSLQNVGSLLSILGGGRNGIVAFDARLTITTRIMRTETVCLFFTMQILYAN